MDRFFMEREASWRERLHGERGFVERLSMDRLLRGEKVFVEKSTLRREASRRDSLHGENSQGEGGFAERPSPGRNLSKER